MTKVILITGASSGIGKASALQLIEEGHTVYGAARSVDKMQDLVEAGGHALKLDVTAEEQIQAAVKQVIDEQGKINVLFNNAGYGLYGAVEDIPIDEARHQFDVNLFGLARMTQEVLPHMRKQKSGTIINTSSMGGKMYTPLGAWYHATKHALEGWSDCLRIEVKQFGIDVVIIEPGLIDTEFSNVLSERLAKNPGTGAYKNIADSLEKSMGDGNMQSSPPTVIANVVSKAVNSEHPRTRYVAGKMASQMMFIRKWFGDRFFDWVLQRYMQ